MYPIDELDEQNRELMGLLQMTCAVFDAADVYYEDCLEDDDIDTFAKAISTFNRLCPDPLRKTDFAKLCASLADFNLANEQLFTSETAVAFHNNFPIFIKQLTGFIIRGGA